MTFFGHPLFTAMTGIGLAVALRSKSKIVRIVAPLAGFCAAAFLHMLFNATASLVSGPNLLLMYLFVALPLVIGLIVFVVRQLFREGRLIRERLIDYVRTGWLPDGDPLALSKLRTRLRALWHAVFTGPDTFLDTIRMQRAATELAYLRDSIARGLVDDAGLAREKILLDKIRDSAGPGDRAAGGPGSLPLAAPAESSRSRSRTRRRATPARRDSAGTTPRHLRRPVCRWGRLLPRTPRSIPPGNLPARELSRRSAWAGRSRRWRRR